MKLTESKVQFIISCIFVAIYVIIFALHVDLDTKLTGLLLSSFIWKVVFKAIKWETTSRKGRIYYQIADNILLLTTMFAVYYLITK